MRTSGLVDNVMSKTKGTERGLDKLESIMGTKNLRRNTILSDYLCDAMGARSDNLKAIVEKVDPTHMSVVIKKHDIVVMAQNRGDTRGTPNIIVKKIKTYRRGDNIMTRVRRSKMFVQLT